jgi:hypothetical protein
LGEAEASPTFLREEKLYMALDDYTGAFRSNNGLSLDGKAFWITGTVAPTDVSVPAALPLGSLYTNTTTGITYAKHDAAPTWVALEGAFHHYGMSSATVAGMARFSFTSVVSGTSYFLTIRNTCQIELGGVNGGLFRNSSTGKQSTVPVLRQGSSSYTTSFLAATPAWAILAPGEYIVKPAAAGTLTLDVYGYDGYSAALVGSSQTATTGIDAGVFHWSSTFVTAESR